MEMTDMDFPKAALVAGIVSIGAAIITAVLALVYQSEFGLQTAGWFFVEFIICVVAILLWAAIGE